MAVANKIRFYLDENIAKEVAEGLHTCDIDVVTTPEIGHMGFANEEHLASARVEKRVFVTEDEDFLVLHSKGIPHAGIAYYKQRTLTIKEVIRALTLIYEVMTDDEMMNRIEYL